MVRAGSDMPDTVFFQLLLEAGLAPPVGVLASIVGQNLPRNPILGHRPAVGLQHVLGRLAAVQPQGRDVAAVIVDEADQVGVAAPKPDGQNVALPELVRPRPLEEPRLGRVLLRFDRALFDQPPPGQRLVDRRGACAHQEKTLEHIGDPPGSVLRMLRLDSHRLLQNLACQPGPPTDRSFGLEPRSAMQPVRPHPAPQRMRADPELLHHKISTAAFLQE